MILTKYIIFAIIRSIPTPQWGQRQKEMMRVTATAVPAGLPNLELPYEPVTITGPVAIRGTSNYYQLTINGTERAHHCVFNGPMPDLDGEPMAVMACGNPKHLFGANRPDQWLTVTPGRPGRP